MRGCSRGGANFVVCAHSGAFDMSYYASAPGCLVQGEPSHDSRRAPRSSQSVAISRQFVSKRDLLGETCHSSLSLPNCSPFCLLFLFIQHTTSISTTKYMNYVKEWVHMMSCKIHRIGSAIGKKTRVRIS